MTSQAPLTPAIPTIETPRLLLRGHTVADLADSAAMWADPEVTRNIGGRPSTREETWAKVLRVVGHWSLLGFGYWVVRERATDRFVGEVGYANFERDIDPPLAGAPEGGWVLAPWAQGKGYATEAVKAATAWLEERFGPVRTVCIIDRGHAPSLRVAEKCGYRPWVETTYHGDEVIVLERPAGACESKLSR
ncbi:acetyltransferase, GNAT family protein [Minicystis rosea]|nr:acetyltransferase, GNAT family protein [Minicystis rosea]